MSTPPILTPLYHSPACLACSPFIGPKQEHLTSGVVACGDGANCGPMSAEQAADGHRRRPVCDLFKLLVGQDSRLFLSQSHRTAQRACSHDQTKTQHTSDRRA